MALSIFAFLNLEAIGLFFSVPEEYSNGPKIPENLKPSPAPMLFIPVIIVFVYLIINRLFPHFFSGLEIITAIPMSILFLCAFPFCVIILIKRLVSIRSAQKAMRAYNEHCDPNPLLQECGRKLGEHLNVVVRQVWLLQKSSMLAGLGCFENAGQVLNTLLHPSQDLSDELRAACYYNLAEISLCLGNLAAGEDYHTKAAYLSQTLPENARQTLIGSLQEQEGFLMYHAGDYEGAKQIFMELGWNNEQNDTSKVLCTRVFLAYKLGLVLLKTGQEKQARKNYL